MHRSGGEWDGDREEDLGKALCRSAAASWEHNWCGYRPWSPPEKSTHTYRHLHNMAFLLSLKQVIHLEVKGKKAPHTSVFMRLPGNLNMPLETRGSILTSLFFSPLSFFFFFFPFNHLFSFHTTKSKQYSASLSLSACKGPVRIFRVRHWKESLNFKLQMGGKIGWSLESPSSHLSYHSPMQLLCKCTETYK